MIQVTTNDAGIERLVSSMKLFASCMSTQSERSSLLSVDGWDDKSMDAAGSTIEACLSKSMTGKTGTCTDWRRGWDSNPRYLAVRLISSQVHSATLPPLHSTTDSISRERASAWLSHPCKAARLLECQCRHLRVGNSPAQQPACAPPPSPSHSGCAQTRFYLANF